MLACVLLLKYNKNYEPDVYTPPCNKVHIHVSPHSKTAQNNLPSFCPIPLGIQLTCGDKQLCGMEVVFLFFVLLYLFWNILYFITEINQRN